MFILSDYLADDWLWSWLPLLTSEICNYNKLYLLNDVLANQTFPSEGVSQFYSLVKTLFSLDVQCTKFSR